jgi:hypothetical protein
MRKIRVLFVLLFCAVPLVAQQDEEEMFNLPINEFTLGTVDENALLSADPQALKLYEAAVNAEKQPGVFKIPGPAVEAWQEVTKITQGNPFLQVAQKRLGDWKILTDFYEKHKANFDKLKLLFASPALPAAQKSSLASKYLEEFGVTFGTSGIMNLISTVSDKNEITGNDAFKAKIQETKQKRCDLGSGRDCYDLGKNFLTIEYEKMMMFNKACELKYQPGCDAQRKKAEPVAAQTEEKPEKTYAFAEDPVGLLPPFAEADDATKQGADPEVLKLYEAAAALEKSKETLSKPSVAVAAWESVEKAAGKNPFQPVAQQRTADWKKAAADLEARDAALAELEKNIADNSIESSRKVELMTGYLDKYGVVFGTADALSLIAPKQNQAAESGDLYQNYAFHISETVHKEIANNESFKAKVKETVNKRCELKSGADCRVYAENHAADETEKAAYLKKACDFGVQETCSLQVADAPQQVEKENAMSSEEEDKFKAELNQAGRRTRIAVATTTLAVGVVAGGLGGWSFYEMSKAEKDRKKYFDKYNELGEGEPFSLFAKYRKKAENADKKRKKYLILGSVGVGVGAALIATGVTLFCIDFKGEKEVKKKYNVSLGANPLEGTVQFALNW